MSILKGGCQYREPRAWPWHNANASVAMHKTPDDSLLCSGKEWWG